MAGRAPDPRPAGRRRPRALSVAAALAFLLGACSSDQAPDPRAGADDLARGVFAKAFETLAEKYIDVLDPAELGLRGIGGLASLDHAFVVERNGQVLKVTRGDRQIAFIPAPANGDIAGWSRATAQAVAVGRGASSLIAAATAEDIYAAVLGGAVAPLDRHTRYAGLSSARDYRAQREGFGGVGVRLNFEHGRAEIITILPDTPAEASGLQAGDVVLAVDGQTVEGMDRDTVIWMLRGRVGSTVALTVTRRDLARPLTVALKRALIVSPTVQLAMRDGIAVISVTGFNQRTARNLVRTLDGLRGSDAVRGLVLDLRGNPGGLLDQAVAVADAFLGRGRIVSTRGRHPDSFQAFDARGRDMAERLPMAVLINGQSASAAEIVAAALQDHGRAVVVGSNSYGKGSVQNITRLPNEGELIVTWSRFHAPSGYALENLGVLPNFCTNRPTAAGPLRPAAARSALSLAELAAEGSVTLAAWRTHSGYDAESAKPLRERCPRRSEKPEDDIEIAEQVLADAQLYARAIAASQPVLARSGN